MNDVFLWIIAHCQKQFPAIVKFCCKLHGIECSDHNKVFDKVCNLSLEFLSDWEPDSSLGARGQWPERATQAKGRSCAQWSLGGSQWSSTPFSFCSDHCWGLSWSLSTLGQSPDPCIEREYPLKETECLCFWPTIPSRVHGNPHWPASVSPLTSSPPTWRHWDIALLQFIWRHSRFTMESNGVE